MNSWDNYRFLLALHQCRTMAAAARRLGTDTATVSRRIDKLNETFGLPVFLKRAEGWEANPRLMPLITLIEEFSAKLECAHNNLSSENEAQIARLVIGCPPFISSRILLPAMRLEADPPARVQFTFLQRIQEEGLGDCDIAIRVGPPEGGRVITRLAGRLGFRLYRPKGMDTGTRWAGLPPAFDTHGPMILGFSRFGQPPELRVAQFEHLLDLSRVVGLSVPLPEVMGDTDPELERVPDSGRHETDFWLLFHETRAGDMVLRQTVDWMIRAFRDSLPQLS